MQNNPPFTAVAWDEHTLTAWREQLTLAASKPELQHQLSSQQRDYLPRFAQQYQTLRALPRRLRRSLQRQWKQTLAGIALLLALGQGPALAATLNVDAGCTLVDAITAANTDTATGGCAAGSGADTLILPTNSTQTLTAVNTGYFGPTGLPVITSDITIEGNGSTIVRDNAAPDFRIFAVNGSGSLTLQETTITGGRTSGFGEYGGGVLNRGPLTLTNSTLSGNSTSGNFSRGGGVFNSDTLTLINSTLSGNSTSGDNSPGGGVSNLYGTLTLTDSTLSGNSTSGTFSNGGGVYNYVGDVTLTDSTLSGNSTSGNFSPGGGVYNFVGTLILSRTLVSGNTAALSSGSEIASSNSITPDAFNLFGHSGLTTAQALVNVTPGATDLTATSDGTTPTALANILNTSLAHNGGPTQTQALVSGSPAIDAAGTTCPATDQRGIPRPQGAACDIGAFEVLPATTCPAIPTIFGTSNSEVIFGTNGPDVIFGAGGNDTLNGLDGNDVLCGSDGNDTLNGGEGNDRLFGKQGNDTLNGDTGDDLLFGQNGDDTLDGGVGRDTLRGGPGADLLMGGNQFDRLFGEAGNDQLFGQNDPDRLDGGPGTDSCDGGTGAGIDAAVMCETTSNVP